MPTMVEEMFKRMADMRDEFDERLKEQAAITEISGEAYSAPISTLANAPLAADGMDTYAFRFISNGRKGGEGAGNGTGLLAYYNPATNSWLRVSDDTAVTV